MSECVALWEDQRTPALAIVARGDQITMISPTEYAVRSQSNPASIYNVVKDGRSWTCDCDHHTEVERECIHILAVKFRNDLRESITPEDDRPGCDRCGSVHVVKNGTRKNKSGPVTRYLCKTCGRKFTGNDGFQKRRADPEKIALALDLYFRGLSVREVAEHFKQVYELDVSHMTVYRWVRHYSTLAASWMDEQSPECGDRWNVDETVVKVDGEPRYLWNVLDHESRFLLATHVSKNRSMQNTRIPLKKAKNATDNRPTKVYTDGMRAYPRAVRKELGHQGGPGTSGYVSPHVRVPSIRAAESNNRVERLQGTEKDRIKVMRGFDQDDGCADLMEGFRVHYNIVRDHQALGITPGEAAGLPTVDGFRWLNVLKKATTERLIASE